MARKIRSTEHHSWAARDGGRAVLAVMLVVFVGAASFSDGKLVPDFTSRDAAVLPDPQPTDDDHRTGSILITPADGNICEVRLIDNETWRIRANGVVQCDEAVRWHPDRGVEYTATSRIEAIRDGFVSKR